MANASSGGIRDMEPIELFAESWLNEGAVIPQKILIMLRDSGPDEVTHDASSLGAYTPFLEILLSTIERYDPG